MNEELRVAINKAEHCPIHVDKSVLPYKSHNAIDDKTLHMLVNIATQVLNASEVMPKEKETPISDAAEMGIESEGFNIGYNQARYVCLLTHTKLMVAKEEEIERLTNTIELAKKCSTRNDYDTAIITGLQLKIKALEQQISKLQSKIAEARKVISKMCNNAHELGYCGEHDCLKCEAKTFLEGR